MAEELFIAFTQVILMIFKKSVSHTFSMTSKQIVALSAFSA
jgi:hypothetical protein